MFLNQFGFSLICQFQCFILVSLWSNMCRCKFLSVYRHYEKCLPTNFILYGTHLICSLSLCHVNRDGYTWGWIKWRPSSRPSVCRSENEVDVASATSWRPQRTPRRRFGWNRKFVRERRCQVKPTLDEIDVKSPETSNNPHTTNDVISDNIQDLPDSPEHISLEKDT